MVQCRLPGAAVMRSDFDQLRGAIIDAGYLTEQEFDPAVRRLDNPDFMMPSPRFSLRRSNSHGEHTTFRVR